MARPRLVPALADLTQDIAGPIPVDLLTEWVAGRQDLDKARALLSPFELDGIVVSSDSSGLTELTEHADLVDVLAMVSKPKEILHALGDEVGGRAIGTWVADNTQMFYPPSVAMETVVSAMFEAQARISATCQVRVGLCAHQGAFYEIGGGLYGGDASLVEMLAETYAGPGELLLTEPSASDLVTRGIVTATLRPELSVHHAPGVMRVIDAPGTPHLAGSQRGYPHPFPARFFDALGALAASGSADASRAHIYDTWLRERTVVFLVRDRPRRRRVDITDLLDELSANAVMEAIIRQSRDAQGHVASLGGGLAILVFDHPVDALSAARRLRQACADSNLDARIGIDVGAVLAFTNDDGPSGLAGDAVNVASKLAEDVGENGTIAITARAAEMIPGLEPGVRFHVVVSRVPLDGIRL